MRDPRRRSGTRWTRLSLATAAVLYLAACSEGPPTIPEVERATPDAEASVDPTSLQAPTEAPVFAPRTGAAASSPVSGANVLIFGDRFERGFLETVLVGLGVNVTNVSTLPADLSPYDAIWHVGAFVPLTGAEQARLAAFLAAGRGVHLTGERPCCERLNASLQRLVNSVVVGGGIQVGGLGDFLPQGPFFTFNPGAVGEITTTPHVLDKWSPAAPGGMAGLAPQNVLVTHDRTGTPNGAAWECSDLEGSAGHLSILMDVNWFNPGFFPGPGRAEVIENVQTFLLRSCVIRVEIDIKPGSDPNSINPSSRGTIPVAILTTDDYDAPGETDRESLTFGRTGDEDSLHRRGRHGVPNCGVEDADGDGDDDLVCHFETQKAGFEDGDTEGILKGTTLGGTPIEGSDAVRIVPSP